VQVQVGRETSIYTDTHPLTHIFTPCAHLTSEKTARYVFVYVSRVSVVLYGDTFKRIFI